MNKELKKSALEALRGNWGKAIGVTLILFFLTNVILSGIEIIMYGGFEAWLNDVEGSLAVDSVNWIITLLLMPLTIAVSWFFLDIQRDKEVGVNQIFAIYKDLNQSLKIVLASLVQSIYIILWALLFIIPGIIKTYSYSQMYYIMRDNPELGINEAITESRKRMDGKKWKLFWLHLSFIGWYILSIFTLGIGLIWVVPYVNAANAAFYDKHIAVKE